MFKSMAPGNYVGQIYLAWTAVYRRKFCTIFVTDMLICALKGIQTVITERQITRFRCSWEDLT